MEKSALDSNPAPAKSLRGAKYCCAINCSNNSYTSIDIRTGKVVKMHRFPNPDTDRDR